MSFERKYNLTVDENIFIAKRNIIDYIWKSAKLDGLSVTFVFNADKIIKLERS